MKNDLKKIIVVDDNNANLVACKNILKPYYMVYSAPSAAKMFGLMEDLIPDLVLMDVAMPDMNGYEAVGRMKSIEEFKNIPIIFLSGRVDPTSEIFGLNMGALDYIHKPFVSELLLRRIKTHLSLIDYQKTLKDRNKSIESFLKHSYAISTPLIDISKMLDNAVEASGIDSMRDRVLEVSAALKNHIGIIDKIFDMSKAEIVG